MHEIKKIPSHVAPFCPAEVVQQMKRDVPKLSTLRFPAQLTENVPVLGLGEMEFTGLCFALAAREVFITHQL